MFQIEGNEYFSILHSVEDNSVGLIVVSPFNFYTEYELELDESTLNQLKINSEKDVTVVNTVTLNSSIKETTINLKAPIIINMSEKLGEQIILEDSKYAIKHPLIQE